MIWTMVYMTLVSLLLGLCAASGEAVLGELHRPRRGVWLGALATSWLLPAAVRWAAPAGEDSTIFSIPVPASKLVDTASDALSAGVAALTSAPWLHWPQWGGFDSVLLVFWLATSATSFAVLEWAWLRVGRRLRGLERTNLGGREVLVSERLGPAVFGALEPRVVLPRWVVEDATLRDFVLRHEFEHIASRDQLVLLAALLLVALAPWNPVLWWQLRRLRLAVEVDCDARVLRRGADESEYCAALLSVRQRLAPIPLGAVALGERVSELERRIGIMVDRSRRFRVSVIGRRVALGTLFGVLACSLNAPAQESASRFQPVWPEFRPAVAAYAGSLASATDGLPLLTLVYDESGTLLGSDFEYFPNVDAALLEAGPDDERARQVLPRQLKLAAAHAAAVFESYGEPPDAGEPIFFRSPLDARKVLLVWASRDFMERTMAGKAADQ